MGTILEGAGLLVTPPLSEAFFHQGARPVAFSSQETLFHMMSSQLLPTMPPVSWEFWFQHLGGFGGERGLKKRREWGNWERQGEFFIPPKGKNKKTKKTPQAYQKSMLGTLLCSASSVCMYRAKSSSIERSDCAAKKLPVSPKITGKVRQAFLSVSALAQNPLLVR